MHSGPQIQICRHSHTAACLRGAAVRFEAILHHKALTRHRCVQSGGHGLCRTARAVTHTGSLMKAPQAANRSRPLPNPPQSSPQAEQDYGPEFSNYCHQSVSRKPSSPLLRLKLLSFQRLL